MWNIFICSLVSFSLGPVEGLLLSTSLIRGVDTTVPLMTLRGSSATTSPAIGQLFTNIPSRTSHHHALYYGPAITHSLPNSISTKLVKSKA